MQRLKMIVLTILILIVGIPAIIAPLHIFFKLFDYRKKYYRNGKIYEQAN